MNKCKHKDGICPDDICAILLNLRLHIERKAIIRENKKKTQTQGWFDIIRGK